MVTSTLAADKNTWNNLSYSQQQEILKANPKLQGALSSLGLTVKSNTPVSVLGGTYDPNKQPTIGGQPVGNQKKDGRLESSTGDYAGNTNTNTSANLLGGTYDPNRQLTIGGQPIGNTNNTNQRGDGRLESSPGSYGGTNNTKSPIKVQSILGGTYDPNKQLTIGGKPITPAKQETPVTTPKKTNTNTNVNRNTGGNNYVSPQQQQWDYQDNSQARMNEIIDNLDRYSVTNPDLFKDYDSFYNFFIAGKGRSEDQIRTLDNYYRLYKRNEKYGNMTPEQVGDGIANGTIPADYIDDVAAKDPSKADAIRAAMNNSQDGIANEGYLNGIAESAGFRTEKSSQSNWASKEGLFIDEDNNWIDDRREHYATQEERDLTDAVLAATKELMKNHNTERDQIDNIIKEYPDIDYGTAVLLANDRNQKLYKRDDELNISIAQMNGTLQYLQAERAEKNKAGADTISQLQKNYQMYMQYSPEGIKELAEAQYEANNPSLEKAETGSDLDKQRAVDSVISEYFDKYGSIIERPKTKVVQDALDYAKKNGVSLSDAINETFTKYLKEKPGYATLAAGGSATGSWSLEAIKDSEGNIVGYVKIDKSTGKVEGVDGTIGGLSGTGEGGYNGTNNGKYTDYTPISRSDLINKLNEFQYSYVGEDGKFSKLGGECGHFVNDYLQKLGYDRLYTDPIDKKKAITNTNTPNVGAVAVMDSKNYPEYGHTAIVTKVYTGNDGNTYVDLLESNWGGDKAVHRRTGVNANRIYGYFDPTINPNTNYSYGENPMSSYLTKLSGKNLNADQKKDLKFVTQSYNLLYRIASSGDLDHLIKSGDLEKLIQNTNSKSFQSTEGDKTFSAVKSMLTKNISDQTNLKTIGDIAELITLKLRKESGAAISAGEWTSGFESFLPLAGENYDTALAKYIRFEQDYLMPSLVYAGGKTEDYKSLFSPNSPYYKKDGGTSTKKVTSTKGTWNIGTSNTQTNNYNTLYNILGI